MTVNTVSPAIISRAEFNLNAGQKQTPQLVRMDFGNLVTNGGFDTDIVGWNDFDARSTSSLQSNRLRITNAGTGGGFGFVDQLISGFGVGRKYNLGWEVSAPATTYATRIFLGTTRGSALAASVAGTVLGAQTYPFTAPAEAMYLSLQLFNATLSVSMDFDNVSIYEADPSDDAPWLRLPYGYSVGRTGMIVRDGVILHPSDYTEVKDSGQTWIKPLVSPGASTEFSIWGSPSYAV